MDPDAALDELLVLIDRMRVPSHSNPRISAPFQEVDRVLELLDGLDSWLTAGGFLPSRWRPASR